MVWAIFGMQEKNSIYNCAIFENQPLSPNCLVTFWDYPFLPNSDVCPLPTTYGFGLSYGVYDQMDGSDLKGVQKKRLQIEVVSCKSLNFG